MKPRRLDRRLIALRKRHNAWIIRLAIRRGSTGDRYSVVLVLGDGNIDEIPIGAGSSAREAIDDAEHWQAPACQTCKRPFDPYPSPPPPPRRVGE